MLILVAGTHETSRRYSEELRRAGFNAEGYGVLEIKPIIAEDLSKQLEDVNFDLLIFTSKNAVRLLFKLTPQSFKHKIALSQIYAIGEETKKELEQQGLSNIAIPMKESSRGLLEELRRRPVKGKAVGIFHSLKVNRELVDGLRSLGALVYSYPLYDIIVNREEVFSLLKALHDNPSSAMIFLAKTALHALMSIDAQVALTLKDRLVIALGESVSNALREHHIPHYIPQKPHISSITSLLRELMQLKSAFGENVR